MGKRSIRRIVPLPGGAFMVLSVDLEAPRLQLQLVRTLLTNPLPLLKAQGAILRQEARQRFAEGGSPAWKRLADSTVASKALAGLPQLTGKGNVPRRLKQNGNFGPTNILIATGALRDSWGLKNDKNHIETYDTKSMTVTIGSKVPYADFHQQGTNAYEILASAGKVLAFTGASGAMIFRSRVHHPGLARRPVTISKDGIARLEQVTQDYLDGELSMVSDQ